MKNVLFVLFSISLIFLLSCNNESTTGLTDHPKEFPEDTTIHIGCYYIDCSANYSNGEPVEDFEAKLYVEKMGDTFVVSSKTVESGLVRIKLGEIAGKVSKHLVVYKKTNALKFKIVTKVDDDINKNLTIHYEVENCE
jgi:hypothetical protein